MKRATCAAGIAYGMITSDMGLLEIPHVSAPASAQDLKNAMREQVFPEIAPFPITFIPGVRNFAAPVDLENFGMMDMMRGEETEAIGLYDLLGLKEKAMLVPARLAQQIRCDERRRKNHRLHDVHLR